MIDATIGSVCTFLNGGTPSKSEPRYFEGDIPWITGADILGPTVKSARSYITKEAIKSSATNQVPSGTVLLVTRTSVGKVAVAGTALCFSQDITAITPDPRKVDTGFLVQFLRTKEYHFKRLARGATIKGITRDVVADLRLPLPSLSEQRRIADLLDRVQSLRAKRRISLAQLDTLTQSIFLDMFGDPATNPKGWPEKAMAALFSASPIFGTMIPPVSERRKWLSLRVGNIQDWNLDLSDRKYVDLPTESVERHSVKKGDLLIARAIASQDHLGKCIVANPHGENWAFDSHLMRLRFDFKQAEPEFIRHLFMTPGGRSLFLRVTRKSTVQFNINTKEISALRLPIPPIKIQLEFTRFMQSVAKLRAAQRASLAELDVLFTSLQHRAFRGEL